MPVSSVGFLVNGNLLVLAQPSSAGVVCRAETPSIRRRPNHRQFVRGPTHLCLRTSRRQATLARMDMDHSTLKPDEVSKPEHNETADGEEEEEAESSSASVYSASSIRPLPNTRENMRIIYNVPRPPADYSRLTALQKDRHRPSSAIHATGELQRACCACDDPL